MIAGPVVHLVDDDFAQRHTVAVLLAHHGFATRDYADAESLLAAYDGLAPGCLMIDVRLPGISGLALQQELRRRGCELPVIMLTGHPRVAEAVAAMKAGAIDFLEKPFGEAVMLAAVRGAMARLAEIRSAHAQRTWARARLDALSPREAEVLRALIGGRANKVIAADLGISPRTVEIHRARLMEKLDCRSLAEVLRLALDAGMEPGGF